MLSIFMQDVVGPSSIKRFQFMRIFFQILLFRNYQLFVYIVSEVVFE